MSKHPPRSEVDKNSQGYHWSARKNKWGRGLRNWRLRLDRQNIAKITEDEAGVLRLTCANPLSPGTVGLMHTGGSLEDLKGAAMRWCRNLYGDHFDFTLYPPQPSYKNPHAEPDLRPTRRAPADAMGVHAADRGADLETR